MLRVRIACVFVALGAVFVTACAGSDSGDAGGAGGQAAVPAAPQLVSVMPMAAVLHVEWTTASTCDFVSAERKDDQHPDFTDAFEVTGDKTSRMDGDAAADTMYTYRLRCKIGEAFSAYSNEMSANPTEASP